MDRPNLLGYAQAAEYIGLAEATVRRYVFLRLLPHIKLGRKLVRFKAEDLAQWIDQHAVPSKCSR